MRKVKNSIFLFNLKLQDVSQNSKLKSWQNAKTQIVIKLKNSNCNTTQTQILTKLKNTNSDNSKLKFWQLKFWKICKKSFGKNNLTCSLLRSPYVIFLFCYLQCMHAKVYAIGWGSANSRCFLKQLSGGGQQMSDFFCNEGREVWSHLVLRMPQTLRFPHKRQPGVAVQCSAVQFIAVQCSAVPKCAKLLWTPDLPWHRRTVTESPWSVSYSVMSRKSRSCLSQLLEHHD